MSTNLYWEPYNRKKQPVDGDVGLKWAMQKKYGYPVSVILSHSDIPWLEGVRDSATEGTAKAAEDLIEQINKHEEIEVTEE